MSRDPPQNPSGTVSSSPSSAVSGLRAGPSLTSSLANFKMMLSVEIVKNRHLFSNLVWIFFLKKALYIRPVLTRASACGNALSKT